MPGSFKSVRILAFCAVVLATALAIGMQGRFGAAQSKANYSPADYTGIWHLMFQGKPFATMTIEQHGLQFTGSVTHAHMQMDGDGRLTAAEAAEGSGPIVRASLKGGALHIVTKDSDGDEMQVAMTLTSAKTGELQFEGEGAPPNAETIPMEKVWPEPPVQK